MLKSFISVRADDNNPKWGNMIKREKSIYKRRKDLRTEFERDYARVIHCTAYRRLKHKTQVFYSPENDHICTRIEHVTHVESISYTIAKYLGLNQELTRAIAIAHDIGHSPFGHEGEKILNSLSMRDIGDKFWHEKNGLEMVDKIELLEDNMKNRQNLNLTYAVRDGIISHCGEIDENCLKPREEFIDLNEYQYPNQFSPYTWEGCIVKIADKISYLGRDIEDAICVGILDENLLNLYESLNLDPNKDVVNNTVIINDLINDICENSSIDKGLCFSDKMFEMANRIKKFNYDNIYLDDRIKPSKEYFKIVLNQIYEILKLSFSNFEKVYKMYPKVIGEFRIWLQEYWNRERKEKNKNDVVFDVKNEKEYYKAIIYYISGMTDNYAIETYNNIIGF